MRQPACLFSWPARRMESGKTKKGSVTPNETSDLERLDIVPVRLPAAVRCRQRDWKHTAGRGEPRGLWQTPCMTPMWPTAALLWSARAAPHPFRDVGSWSPYFEALCWAKASGIAGGYAGGAFRPAAPVTRQQATVMLYRYAKTTDLPLEKGSDRDLAGYRDADTIPTWSREAVQWAVRNGLWFSGSATELQAAENVSWEELAVLTQRLFLGGMPRRAALSAAPEGLTMELQQWHYHRRGCGTAKCRGGDLLLWGGLRSLSAGERRLVSDEQGNGHHRHCL